MFRHHVPSPPLAKFIDKIWYYQCFDIPNRVDRILPSGDMGIVINLREAGFQVDGQEFPGAIVSGAHTSYFSIDTAQQAYTMGICFKPGGAFPFLPVDIQNRHVALSDVWGAPANHLREQLMSAKTIDQRFQIIEAALLARMKPPRDPHPAVAYALGNLGRISLAELSSHIGLSQKRFTDVFREEVGLTPKLFCRVRRFQSVLRRINAAGPLQWADLLFPPDITINLISITIFKLFLA